MEESLEECEYFTVFAWHAAFYWLGGFMLIIAGLNYIVLRNKPQDKGFPTKQQAANILMFWAIGMGVGCFSIGWASDRILKSCRKASLYGMLIYIITWLPMILWTDAIPVWMFYPLLFIMGFWCGSYVPNYAHIAEGQPHSFIATANGMLNIWDFAGRSPVPGADGPGS